MNLLSFKSDMFQLIFSGLYTTLGGAYDLIAKIQENMHLIKDKLSGVTDTLYLLIGVFMVFRIGVSLIQYLVDPDKVNDKQEGGGKLISRILIAIVLIFTFPIITVYMDAIERYLITDSGLTGFVDRLFQTTGDGIGLNDGYYIANKILFLDVSAEERDWSALQSDGDRCFYIKLVSVPNTSVFKLTSDVNLVWYNIQSRPTNIKADNEYQQFNFNLISSKPIPNYTNYYVYTGTLYDKGKNIKYKINGDFNPKVYNFGYEDGIKANGYKYQDIETKCLAVAPKPQVGVGGNESTITYETAYDHKFVATFDPNNFTNNIYENKDKMWQPASEVPLYVGGRSLYKLIYDVSEWCKNNGDKCNFGEFNNAEEYIKSMMEFVPVVDPNTGEETISDEAQALSDNIGEAYIAARAEANGNTKGGNAFARTIFSTFVNRKSLGDEIDYDKWFDPKDGQFLSYTNGSQEYTLKKLASLYDNDQFDIDYLMAIIVPIVLMVFLIILVIDVVVRGLKLIFLQVIAPIPIMCYMNPKDKIFNEWIKMYLSTYADLFIKLLGLEIAIRFIDVILSVDFDNLLLRILFILGAFLFAKAVPDMISKLFGINTKGGTFGQAAGLVKKGLGLGAGIAGGAIAGGIAGAATGMGHGGRLSSVLGGFGSGMMRGAAGGTKGIGGIKKGISTQYQHNKAARASNAAGGNWRQRALSKVNMDAASRTDRSLELKEGQNKLYDQFAAYEKSAEDAVDSTNFMQDLRSMKDQNGNSIFTNEQLKDINHDYMNFLADKNNAGKKYDFEGFTYRMMNEKNDDSYYNAMQNAVNNSGIDKNRFEGSYQPGKAVAVQSSLANASSYLQSNSTISDAAKTNSPVNNYEDLHTATANVKSAKTANEKDIIAAKATSQYSAADASRQNNNKK